MIKAGDRLEVIDPTESGRMTMGALFTALGDEFKSQGMQYVDIESYPSGTPEGLWYAYRFKVIRRFTINNQTKVI